MAIRFEEMPTSRKGSKAFQNPQTTLEVWAYGAHDENELEAGVEGWLESTYTVNGVTRFFESYSYEPKGNTIWTIQINYRKSPNTNELTVHPGGGTRKLFQSYETKRVYNCATATSSITNDAVTAAAAEAVAVNNAANAIAALVVTADADALAANIASLVAGVDAGVAALVVSTDDAVSEVTNYCRAVATAGLAVGTATQAAATAAAAGNGTLASSSAATALDRSNNATTQAGFALTSSNTATTRAAAAVAAAVGHNAQTIAAGAAANTAAVAALAAYTGAHATAIAAAVSEALAAAAAAATADDISPGGNGSPDFGRAIGATEHSVEGVDVPSRKLEFSISKKLDRTAISGAYFMTLYGMLCTTNNAAFTIVYNGQTFTFEIGTLLFLEFPFKMNSDWAFDITYKFAAQKSLKASDNFRIGASGVITVTGWEYLWIYYRETQDAAASRLVRKPIAAYVERTFETSDYGNIIWI